MARWQGDQTVRTVEVGVDRVVLEASRHDPVRQRVDSQLMVLSEGIRLQPIAIRYAWPAELDLMARLAGLSLAHRWSDWQRSPFSAASTSHVSVYRRANQDPAT